MSLQFCRQITFDRLHCAKVSGQRPNYELEAKLQASSEATSRKNFQSWLLVQSLRSKPPSQHWRLQITKRCCYTTQWLCSLTLIINQSFSFVIASIRSSLEAGSSGAGQQRSKPMKPRTEIESRATMKGSWDRGKSWKIIVLRMCLPNAVAQKYDCQIFQGMNSPHH